MFTIGSVLAIILQCNPVAAGYDLTLRAPTGTGTCYSIDIFKKVGVFNSCKPLFLIPLDLISAANQHSHQHRHGPAVRYLAHSIGVETATHHSHENWSSLYPQPGILRSGYCYLQNANAVPLLRDTRLYRPRLMVLYVFLDIVT